MADNVTMGLLDRFRERAALKRVLRESEKALLLNKDPASRPSLAEDVASAEESLKNHSLVDCLFG
jgi:hypothetical protein